MDALRRMATQIAPPRDIHQPAVDGWWRQGTHIGMDWEHMRAAGSFPSLPFLHPPVMQWFTVYTRVCSCPDNPTNSLYRPVGDVCLLSWIYPSLGMDGQPIGGPAGSILTYMDGNPVDMPIYAFDMVRCGPNAVWQHAAESWSRGAWSGHPPNFRCTSQLSHSQVFHTVPSSGESPTPAPHVHRGTYQVRQRT